MIYPEIPKSKFRPTYIAGGIFAFLFGIIALGLFIPGLLKYCLNMNAPWDWNSIGITGDMLQFVSYQFINTLLPVVLILATSASFFIGRAKSSVFMKSAIMCFLVALLVRYIPLDSLNSSIKQIIELIIGIVGVVFVVLGFIFLFKGEGKTQPYRANSFHIFTAIYFMVVVIFDAIYRYFGFGSAFEANYYYYFPTCFYGLYGVIAGVWMLVLMKRDPLEFGGDPSRFAKEKGDKKLAKEQAKQAKLAEKEAAMAAKQAEKDAKAQAKAAPAPEPAAQPQPQPQPTPAAQPAPAPEAQPQPASQPQAAPQPAQPQAAPRPNLPPLQVGPDGVKYRLITQRLPNGKVVQLRIDEHGKPLPPLPQKPQE